MTDSGASATSIETEDDAFDDETDDEGGVGPARARSLTFDEIKEMFRGFVAAGFTPVSVPRARTNPILVEWRRGDDVRKYKLWTFGVRPGGGQNSESRKDTEYRVQATSGPDRMVDFDTDGYKDLLVGYYPEDNAVIFFDRYWLESLTQRYEAKTAEEKKRGKGSNSLQINIDQIIGRNEVNDVLENGAATEVAPTIRKVVKQLKATRQATLRTSPGKATSYVMEVELVPEFLDQIASVPAPAPIDVEDAIGTTEVVLQKVRGASDPTIDIVAYCEARGFTFEADLIARYVAAFLAKPLVILAGISGTGKSKLAELVAEFYSRSGPGTDGSSAEPETGAAFVFQDRDGLDRDRLALVPVRPDWVDNKSILGFVNPISGRYQSTQALDMILRAGSAVDRAGLSAPRHFMILDEMNLAKVEHYFSDWLACTESRRRLADGSIVQQPVSLHRIATTQETDVVDADGTRTVFTVPPFLPLPTNIVVTGTVNVDETTHGFSSKVLDRSMVLEFDDVDLDGLRSGAKAEGLEGYRFPKALPDFRLPTRDDYVALPMRTHEHLVAINAILEVARLHFGYRAATEMARFMWIYNDILPEDVTDTEWRRALDAAVLQKILPRLNGNRAKLSEPLAQLCAYLRDLAPSGTVSAIEEFDPDARAGLPRSYQRAMQMWRGLASFGYASFFR